MGKDDPGVGMGENAMSWVFVGNIEEIPPCSGRPFRTLNGEEIGIFHLTDGRILAVENRCPHRGGALTEGIVSNQFVFCPLPDRKIDLEKGEVQPPDTGCVRTFSVKIQDNAIWIKCDESERRFS